MAIGTTAALIGGGALLGSSALGAYGANKAGKAQAKQQQAANQLYYDIYQQQREDLSPYAMAGKEALFGLQQINTPEGREDFLRNYANTGEFQALSDAARSQQLAAAEATGGLGATSTSNALAQIAPQLGLSALQNQQNQLGQLVNVGLSGAGSQAGYAGQYGQFAGQGMQNLGAINAGRAAAPFQALSGFVGDVGGLYLGSKLGLF